MRKLLLAFPAVWCCLATYGRDSDSLSTYEMSGIRVEHPADFRFINRSKPVASTSMSGLAMERERVLSLKDMSVVTPNFYIPDYGSRMTSSVYVRGMGTRIDNPVVGLYVDGVPYMNKNNFDFDFFDISRMEIMRGPQGTLCGRNSMGGTVNIRTLSPLEFRGTRFALDYGSGRTFSTRVSYYAPLTEELGVSVGGYYAHSNGFYVNDWTGQRCDNSDGSGMRLRLDARRGRTYLNVTAAAGHVRQGGYPYSPFDVLTGEHGPVSYNDPCSYRRENLTLGVGVRHSWERVALDNTASYQYTDDCMTLDQDFTPRSMFTLSQAQKDHVVTEEIVLRPVSSGRYEWLAGAFAMYRNLNTSAPVTFKEDGIRTLIEDNMNKGIHTMFPDDSIDIRQTDFVLGSRFTLRNAAAALFHTSTLRLLDDRLELCAGIRLDYECSEMLYDSRTRIDYRFSATMSDYRPLDTELEGSRSLSYFEVLPKLSAMYRLRRGPVRGNVFVSAAKGYKAGGFNIQMFSDILQNRLRDDMLSDLGLHLGDARPYDVKDVMSYRPEYCWNYEIGTHLDLPFGGLRIDASVFYIDCRDGQITVFPPGMTTGRMMRNAGRSRSIGTEVSVEAAPVRGLHLSVSYGYTNARFTSHY